MCATVIVREPVIVGSTRAQIGANRFADAVASGAQRVRTPVKMLTAEYSARMRRTPALLPLEHFSSDKLIQLLQAIKTSLDAADPQAELRQACDRFEEHHPFKKFGRRVRGFSDRRGVRFVTPPRDQLHGHLREINSGGHNERCFLNSRVRLGGYFDDGFHYDCTVEIGNYEGHFDNCHRASNRYDGRPHLNVYPNDYIRGPTKR
jgi:hypothetical protein